MRAPSFVPSLRVSAVALVWGVTSLAGCASGDGGTVVAVDAGTSGPQVDGSSQPTHPEKEASVITKGDAEPPPQPDASDVPVETSTGTDSGPGRDVESTPQPDANGTRPDAGSASSDSGVVPPKDAGGTSGFQPCPAQGTACAIMPLGDSITYGYGSTDSNGNDSAGYRIELFTQAVAANKTITFVGTGRSPGPSTVSGKPFSTANEGHSGYTIDTASQGNGGIMPLVDRAISSSKPHIVLLMAGTNDMHYSIDLANAPARLGKLIDKVITDAPDALVVVAQIVSANGSQNNATITFNAAIPALVQARAAQGKHIVLVDMYTPLGAWSKTNFRDSEHPNNAGYALMAKTWYPAIEKYLR